jgi:surface protein
MFDGCSSLTELDLSKLNVNQAIYEYDMLHGCTKLTKLSIHPSMESLDTDACAGVGTETAPCTLLVPKGFAFPEDTDTTQRVFMWCGGYFTLGGYIYTLGDVNHDGFVNIYDVTLMIDYILGLNPVNFHVNEADVNDDGFINIYDVTLLIDIILAKE